MILKKLKGIWHWPKAESFVQLVLNNLSQCPLASMAMLSAALCGLSSEIIFPFLPYCMQIIPKQTWCKWLEFVSSDFLEAASCLGVASVLVVSFLIASLCLAWCQLSLCCVYFRQKPFPIVSDVTGAGRLSNKCSWAEQYRFHKSEALCKTSQPLEAMDCRAPRSGGDTLVTWPEPDSSTARTNWPGQALGTAIAAFSNAYARVILRLPDAWKALLTPLFLCSGSLPPTDKQPISELVGHWFNFWFKYYWERTASGFPSSLSEQKYRFSSPFQLQFNSTSRKKSSPVKCTRVEQKILLTRQWVVPTEQVLAKFHFKILLSGVARGLKFLKINKSKAETFGLLMVCLGSSFWSV